MDAQDRAIIELCERMDAGDRRAMDALHESRGVGHSFARGVAENIVGNAVYDIGLRALRAVVRLL